MLISAVLRSPFSARSYLPVTDTNEEACTRAQPFFIMQNYPEVTELQPVPDAFVPVLSMKVSKASQH